MAYFAFEPNCKELNAAAKDRIRHQTQTAGVTFELLYTEATAYMKGKNLIVFQDHDIHDILVRSGIKRKIFDTEHKANEWFYTDLETVKKAIAAAKEGRTSLNASEISTDRSPVIFRPEQTEAIEKTIKQFKKSGGSHAHGDPSGHPGRLFRRYDRNRHPPAVRRPARPAQICDPGRFRPEQFKPEDR